MTANAGLRSVLQDITDRYVGFLVAQQIPKIAAARTTNPHSILVLEKVRLGNPRTYAFNCHAFTFGLAKIDECWESVGEVCPDGSFVARHLVPLMNPRADGDVILYFDGDRITHSARFKGGLVVSKWGAAHTWQHGLWEVPASYGSRVEYYQGPSPEIVKHAYLAI